MFYHIYQSLPYRKNILIICLIFHLKTLFYRILFFLIYSRFTINQENLHLVKYVIWLHKSFPLKYLNTNDKKKRQSTTMSKRRKSISTTIYFSHMTIRCHSTITWLKETDIKLRTLQKMAVGDFAKPSGIKCIAIY